MRKILTQICNPYRGMIRIRFVAHVSAILVGTTVTVSTVRRGGDMLDNHGLTNGASSIGELSGVPAFTFSVVVPAVRLRGPGAPLHSLVGPSWLLHPSQL